MGKDGMIKAISQYLDRIVSAGKDKAGYDNQDVADAIASLFKQMALADGVVKKEEISAAIGHLVSDYGYLDDNSEGSGIVDKFGRAEGESVFALASVINKSLSAGQRKQLKAQLLATALSDDEFHEYEQDLMELLNRLIKS